MSVSNDSSGIIADITLDFIFDENLLHIADHGDYPVKNGKFELGNIYGKKSKTFTILFDPLTCTKAADIKCQVNYADHEGRMHSVWMEPKEISVVCPIMKTDQDINIGRLKEFIEKLPSRDSRVYEIQSGFDVKKLAHLAREVVEKHDVRHIRTLHTRDGRTCEIWYYGRTKVTKDDIVIRVSIFTEHQTIELFAATRSADTLTGLLAEVGRDMKQTVESRASGRGRVVNLTIKDSLVQRSNLLDMCDIDGTCDVNVVIEDSVVQRSSIATADEEARLRREQEKREEEERLRREQEERVRREQEELERRRREEEEREAQEASRLKAAEEAEKKRKAEAERKRQEEEKLRREQVRKEEEARKAQEASRLKAAEEAENKRRAEAERKRQEEEKLRREQVRKEEREAQEAIRLRAAQEAEKKRTEDFLKIEDCINNKKKKGEEITQEDKDKRRKALEEVQKANIYITTIRGVEASLEVEKDAEDEDRILDKKIKIQQLLSRQFEVLGKEQQAAKPAPVTSQSSHVATPQKPAFTSSKSQNLPPAEEKSSNKVLLVPMLIIIVIAGYLLVSPQFADVASTQDSPKTYTNSIGMEFVLIPAGEFEMGSPSNEEDRNSDEGPVHRVTISNDFYMGKYEVTQKQWVEVMGSNPSNFKGDNLPVENVSWDDVQEFVKKLNAKEGTDKYRLPSEAEWEYACRAGTTTKYCFGDSESKLGEYAWYDCCRSTLPVGRKKPNQWGLYDMHGNVCELVQDKWHDSYEGAPVDGSVWEDGIASYSIGRGGSSLNYNIGMSCRSADRGIRDSGGRYRDLGFRLLQEP